MSRALSRATLRERHARWCGDKERYAAAIEQAADRARFVPEAFAGQSGTLGLGIRAKGAHRTIGLTWRTDRPLSAPARRFRDFVTGGGRDHST